MRRTIPTVLLSLVLLPAAALAGDENREAAEASLFRGYYLETVKRDFAAAEGAYNDAAWNGEEFPEIGLRAYLGLARTKARQKKEDAAKYLKAATDWFGRIEESLPPKTAAAWKEEIGETTRLLDGGERRADLDDEIRFQLEKMGNAWGTPVGAEAKQKLTLYGERAVPILAPALRRTDPQLVRNVADVLAKIGGPAAADALAAAAGDPEVLFPVRLAEGVATGDTPELRAVKRKLLESDREEVRWAVASGAQIGSLGIPAIAKMVYDDSERVRAKGMYLFDHVGEGALNEEARPVLEDLLTHGNPKVRAQALKAALEVGGEFAADAVARALLDKEWVVVEPALRAVLDDDVAFEDRFAPGVVEAARSAWGSDAAENIRMWFVERSVDLLADHGDPGGADVVVPLVVLAARDGQVYEKVVRRLDDEPLPPEIAVGGLRALSGEARYTWLSRFASALPPEAVRDLAVETRAGDDDRLRSLAARVLLTRLPPSEWPDLEPYLTSEDPEVRRAAARALLKRDGEKALDRVIHMIDEDRGSASDLARAVLGTLGPDAARTVLSSLLGRSSGSYANAFASVAYAATDDQVLAALRTAELPAVNAAASVAAQRHLKEAWPLLLAMNRYQSAVDALERLRSYFLGMKEYRDLEQSLETDALAKARRLATDPSPNVRRAAALALAAIGDRDAIGVLLDLVTDEDETVRAAAERALERLAGDPGAGGGEKRSSK